MTRPAGVLLLGLAAGGCASAAPFPVLSPAGPLPPALAEGGAADGWDGYPPPSRSWEEVDRLHTTLLPYAWRASGEGESLVETVPASFDEGDDSDRSFGGRAEVYSERVGIFLDGFHTAVHDRDATVEYDDRTFVLDLGAAMRVLGGDPWQMEGERPPLDLEVDGLALVRAHWMKMEATPAGAFSSTTDDAFWLDLVLGMRGALVLVGRVSLFARIDGGGMALNQWRSWTWSGEAGAKVRITRHLGAVAGYRWFRSYWEDGVPSEVVTPLGTVPLDSDRDVSLQGPWVGIVLEF